MSRFRAGKVRFTSVADRFPPGTKVKAYRRATLQGQRPAGGALATATVAHDGTLEFTGLPDEQLLTAHAEIDGQHVLVDFTSFNHASQRPELQGRA